MRTFPISRLTLIEIGGWLTLGLLFWLLLCTHHVVAGALPNPTNGATAAVLPPAEIVADQQLVGPPAHAPQPVPVSKLFWQTRLRLRHDLPVRGVLGAWMPSRAHYFLAERRRPLKREASRPKPVVLPRRAGNLGPALGSVYCRPV